MSTFSGRYLPILANPPVARQFVRNVLKRGIALEESLGVNPFKFGMIASADTHGGTPGLVAEDERYPGHGVPATRPEEKSPSVYPTPST